MEKTMKLRITVFLTLCLSVTGLAACGQRTGGDTGNEKTKDEVETTISSITVNKDGSITSRIVEDFGESYYDEAGLQSMIESSIAEYASLDGAAEVELKSCKASDNRVNVVIEFGDYNSYAGFNRENFFAGTVQGANQAGFDLDVTLQAVSDRDGTVSVSKPELMGMGDRHIVIVDTSGMADGDGAQSIRVNCFGEVLYVSDGVTAAGKKGADVALTGGYGIIVFK